MSRRAAVAVLLPLALGACAHHRRAAAPPRVVHVQGEGRVTARPDLAALALGVEVVAPALADAAREADARMRRVVDALKASGVAEKDVLTTGYDVQMERRWDPNRPGPGEITGYRVAHGLRVLVRGGDAKVAGEALQAAIAAGANAVHGLTFEKADPEPERARALALALAAARAKAEALAAAAGKRLGDPVSVSEVPVGGPPIPLHRMKTMAADEAAGAPLQAGDLEFAAQVQVDFEVR
jgi:uncharacterized protein YggE